jgi:hypothetical protein
MADSNAPETPSEVIRRLAHAVRALSPSWQNTEPFHLAKSEIAAALAQLAHRLGPRVAPAVTATPTPKIVLVRGFPGICQTCARAFQAIQPTKKFCSHACRQSAYRKRLRARVEGAALGAPAAGPLPRDTRQHPDRLAGL